ARAGTEASARRRKAAPRHVGDRTLPCRVTRRPLSQHVHFVSRSCSESDNIGLRHFAPGAPVRHLFVAASLILAAVEAAAQPAPPTPEQLAERKRTYAELESMSVIEHKLMVPMRDGVHLSTDVYRPKGNGKYATIFVRTPYNFNWFD